MKRLSLITLTTTMMLLASTSAKAAVANELGRKVLTQYQSIQAALAGDSIAGVHAAAGQIADIAKPRDFTPEEGAASQALVDAARGMAGVNLATLREEFKQLSKVMPAYLKVTGIDSAQLYFCPMAKAYWLQPKQDGATRNPYLGKAMPTCGTKVALVDG